MITKQNQVGNTNTRGRFVSVRSIASSNDDHFVIITCDGGNCSFQHNMTPNEARELAGYLQAEANFCEQQAKQVEEVAA
jgi:hypothetical protein